MPDQALSLDSLIGLELSHYRIIEEIGSGGMGVVYRAHDQHLDREVAVKVLTPGTVTDEAARKRLREEALALSKLNHPNIATIHDFDTQQGVDFLVMEYISGIRLRERLAAGPLPEKETLRLGVQLAEGLWAAHEHGVVHRDLKPGNLCLTADGGLKILDFGLAKLRQLPMEMAATESSLPTHSISGTLPYMAPEQLEGEEVDARTDIHAAGLVLYEMATGQRPFAELQGGQLIASLLRKPPIPPTMLNPKVSAELERIIGKCLEKDPENRYQSAKELAIDLRRLLTPSAVKVAEVLVAGRKPSKTLVPRPLRRAPALQPAPATSTPRQRKLRVALVSTGVAAIACVAVLATLLYRHSTAPVFSERDWMLVADFENRSGEPLFDDTVSESLRHSLQQSRFVHVVPRAEAVEAARRTGRSRVTRVDAELGRQICERENYRVLLTGEIGKGSANYEINVNVVDPWQGVPVFSESASLRSPNELYSTVDGLAKRLRIHLGESMAQIEKQSTPLAQVTTPSLEALQRYSSAVEHYAGGDIEGFLPLAKSAVEIDPDFAMAHLYLARAYDQLGNRKESRAELAQARRGLNRVTEREHHLILAEDYEAQGLNEKAAEQYHLLTELYPDDVEGYRGLARESIWVGRPEEAIEVEKHILQLDPHSAVDHEHLILWLNRVNNFSDALTAYSAARAGGVNTPTLHWGAGLAHLGQDDPAAARREFSALGQEGGDYEKNLASLLSARVLMYQGHLREATDALHGGLVLDEKLHSETWMPVRRYLLGRVLQAREQTVEARVEARRMAAAAIRPEPEPEELRRAGLLAVDLGDLSTARQLLAQLTKLQLSQDTGYTHSCYYNLKGALELAHGSAAAAAENQQRAAVFFPSFEAYLSLGNAYAAQDQWAKATQAYQRYLDFKGEVAGDDSPSDWVLGHLRLARALARSGDLQRSGDYYDQFLRLWANADPDLPALRQARAERRAQTTAISSRSSQGPRTSY
ncbi:MAG TPA: protein kinase [Candidatus Acidoferrum sp.]|nr:protein kinase [Candidatus Acidoferrum sp.]